MIYFYFMCTGCKSVESPFSDCSVPILLQPDILFSIYTVIYLSTYILAKPSINSVPWLLLQSCSDHGSVHRLALVSLPPDMFIPSFFPVQLLLLPALRRVPLPPSNWFLIEQPFCRFRKTALLGMTVGRRGVDCFPMLGDVTVSAFISELMLSPHSVWCCLVVRFFPGHVCLVLNASYLAVTFFSLSLRNSTCQFTCMCMYPCSHHGIPVEVRRHLREAVVSFPGVLGTKFKLSGLVTPVFTR